MSVGSWWWKLACEVAVTQSVCHLPQTTWVTKRPCRGFRLRGFTHPGSARSPCPVWPSELQPQDITSSGVMATVCAALQACHQIQGPPLSAERPLHCNSGATAPRALQPCHQIELHHSSCFYGFIWVLQQSHKNAANVFVQQIEGLPAGDSSDIPASQDVHLHGHILCLPCSPA